MSWLKNLSEHRRSALHHPLPEVLGQLPAEKVAAKPVIDVSELEGAMVSSKVLAEHGAILAPCAEDMNAIAALAEELEPWRATQLGHAVERYYGALGRQLSSSLAADRPEIARAAIRALRSLVEEVGGGELLSPAIAAMTDLVSWTGRKEPGRDKKLPEALATIAAIRAEVGGLIARLEGRAGVGTALNVYSNLIYQAEKLAPGLAPEPRSKLWGKVAELMADALPRPRIDQVGVARLSQLLSEAIPGAGKDAVKALDAAKKAAHAELADVRREALGQLAVIPEGCAPGTPGREAFDALHAALARVVEANPAGPQTVIDHALILKARLAELAPVATADQVAGFRDAAAILGRVAATPVAEPVMMYLEAHLAALVAAPEARAALAEAAARPDPSAIPGVLVHAHAAAFGGDVPGLARGLGELERLPGTLGVRPALTLLPRLADAALAGTLASALAAYVRRAGAGGLDALGGFADRFSAVYPALRDVIGEAQGSAVASSIAGVFTGEAIPADQANTIAQLFATVQNVLGDLPLAKLTSIDRQRRPGLLALCDPKAFRFDPKPILFALLPAVARAAGAPEAQRVELARLAIHIASELGKLDRDPAQLTALVVADLTRAITEPGALQFGMKAGSGLAIQGQALGKSGGARRAKEAELPALTFARDHGALPAELLFSAGTHLSPAQNTWLLEQVSSSRSRAYVRALRDATFACVTHNRLDLLEALRTSESPPKALAAVAAFVAGEYRQGRLAQVPFDQLIRLLAEGKDPVAEIEAERAREALAAMNMGELAGVKADPTGLAEMKKLSAEIRALVAYVPAAVYRPALVEALKRVADGTWSKARYESDTAKRQLAGLTPKQLQVWMTDLVTPAEKAAAAVVDPELLDAMVIAKGLGQALAREVKLGGPNLPPLAFDDASVTTLRGMRDALLTQLHEKVKGSPEHRELSGKLKPINDNLAVLELHQAIGRMFKGAAPDPVTVMLELKPLIEAAVRPAKRLGGRGCAGALQQISTVTPEVKTSPRQGLHAADEHSLEAYLTSYNGGSCINPINGQNRRALVEFITTPQYRMCRVCNGEAGIARGQLRLFKTELDGGVRHAIWADTPYGVNNCTYAPDEQQKLFFKHAIQKAMAMGVPILFSNNVALQVAKELGYAVEQKAVGMRIDRGITGAHQSEIVAGAAYWVDVPAGQEYHRAATNLSVIMPPA